MERKVLIYILNVAVMVNTNGKKKKIIIIFVVTY